MSGTKWTEPGQGSNALDLRDAIRSALRRTEVFWLDRLVNRARGNLRSILKSKHIRTNLALTGEPLAAEDLERIAEAKCEH